MKNSVFKFCFILSLILLIGSPAVAADQFEISPARGAKNLFNLKPTKKGVVTTCSRKRKKAVAGQYNESGIWQPLKKIQKKQLKKVKRNPAKLKKLKAKFARQLVKQTKRCTKAVVCKPRAKSLTATVAEGSTTTIRLDSNSRCLPGALSYSVLKKPAFGQLVGSGAVQNYTIGHDVPEQTSFTYRVRNIRGKKSKGRVQISVPSVNFSFGGNKNSLAKYRQQLTPAEVRQLLKRVAFGGDQSVVARGQTMNIDQLVDSLLADGGSKNLVGAQSQALAISKSAKDDYNFDVDTDDNGSRETRYQLKDFEWTTNAGRNYWHYLMRYGHGVQERMAFLLHDHFATALNSFSSDRDRSHAIINHINLLRYNALGRFDTLVSDMHWDLAMNYWLDNRFNTVDEPNENYGRELMELFTLGPLDPVTGRPNYSEADVLPSTRAMSGFLVHGNDRVTYTAQIDGGRSSNSPNAPATRNITIPEYNVDWTFKRWMKDPQSPEDISIFPGQSYAESSGMDFESFTNVLLYQHPGSARYIGAKLFSRLIHPNPTEAVVSELAADLIASQYDLRVVLKKIMSSSAMYSSAKSDCITSPVEAFMTFFKVLDLPFEDEGNDKLIEAFNNATSRSGQGTLNPPTVFGWKGCGVNREGSIELGESWLTAQSLLERQKNFTYILNELDDYFNNQGTPWESLLPAGSATAQQVVTYFAGVFGVELSAQENQLLLDYLNKSVSNFGANQSPSDWEIVPTAWDATEEDLVRLKIPGLLSILFLHPDFQTR